MISTHGSVKEEKQEKELSSFITKQKLILSLVTENRESPGMTIFERLTDLEEDVV